MDSLASLSSLYDWFFPLFFGLFSQMLNILEKFVVSKGYTYFRLDGSTPVASRQGLIKKYNEVKVESVVVVISLSFTAVDRELKDDVTRDDS